MNQEFSDITLEEEEQLPLPPGWIKTIKFEEDTNKNGQRKKIKIYRNSLGQESLEHPILAQAARMAFRRILPSGWTLIENPLPNGKTERFYYNSDLRLSLWDHPLLRTCLNECLQGLGFEFDNLNISNNSFETQNLNIPQSPIISEHDRLYTNDLSTPLIDSQSLHNGNISISNDLNPVKYINNEILVPNSNPIKVQYEGERDWTSLLNTFAENPLSFTEKFSHKPLLESAPPISLVGIDILKSDLIANNERIHQLITKLRSLLAEKQNLKCSFLYYDDKINELQEELDNDIFSEKSNRSRSIITLASDIITTLRQEPSLVIQTIANNSHLGNSAMLQIAFIMINRVLHPFSTEPSLTSALLLQSINYQLEEMAKVEQIFSASDSKLIISRALFILDPIQAVKWQPNLNPFPLCPNTPSETTAACLLRTYGVRRDVTCYYRALWKKLLPSITEFLVDLNTFESPFVFVNLVTLAYRLLEQTFLEKSMIIFPTIATTICRAIDEITDKETVLTYIFNFMILPNLIKIIGGDHDSAENEDVYRPDRILKTINQYYESNWWFQSQPPTLASEPEINTLEFVRYFIWTVWRLFSLSVYSTDSFFINITSKEFAGDRLAALNITGFKDTKLRSYLTRLRRKMLSCCELLVKLPVDKQGSQYLNSNPNEDLLQKFLPSKELTDLFHRRLSSLVFRPSEMLNLTVISRHELCALLTDIGCTMDEKDLSTEQSIYQAISDFLTVYGEQDNEIQEEFLHLTFLYEGTEIKNPTDAEELHLEYYRLFRGLKKIHSFESSLTHLIEKTEKSQSSSIYELIQDHEWYYEPEFDIDSPEEKVQIAEKVTEGWKGKVRQPLLGLQHSRSIKVFPLFSKYNEIDHHPNIKSLKQLQKDVIASYRFGSSQPGIDAGTSFGRSKLQAAKVSNDQLKVTTLDSTSRTQRSHSSGSDTRPARSSFTEPTIHKDSSILAPTQAFLNAKLPLPETSRDQDKKFMKSMRDHQIIPTEEFKMRYYRKSSPSKMDSSENAPKPPSMGIKSYAPKAISKPQPAAKPFPDSLRHLIRSEEEEEEIEEFNSDLLKKISFISNNSTTKDFSSNSVKPPQDEQDISVLTSEKPSPNKAWHYDPNYFQNLIKEYQVSVKPNLDNIKSSNVFDEQKSTSRSRSRSPSAPSPYRPSSQSLLKPTESFHNYIQNKPDHSNQFINDISKGITPELRKYEPNSLAASHEESFIPTKSKVYKATGPRIQRLPPFLSALPNEDIVYYSSDVENRSRSPSPASTRGRSRSPGGFDREIPPKEIIRSASISPRARFPSQNSKNEFKAALQEIAIDDHTNNVILNVEDLKMEPKLELSDLTENHNINSIAITQPSSVLPLNLSFKNIPVSSRSDDGNESSSNSTIRPIIPLISKKSSTLITSDNKALFTKGFNAIKYGRSGMPKEKFIRYDEKSKIILWYQATRSRWEILTGAPEPKPSGLRLLAITEVKRGVQTSVLLKAGLLDPSKCISILTDDRTLDLLLPSMEMRDKVFTALRSLLEDRESVKFS